MGSELGGIVTKKPDLCDEQIRRVVIETLHGLGLSDEKAAQDIRDLRSLLDAWRNARRTIWQTFFKTITTAVLIALAAGVGYSFRK